MQDRLFTNSNSCVFQAPLSITDTFSVLFNEISSSVAAVGDSDRRTSTHTSNSNLLSSCKFKTHFSSRGRTYIYIYIYIYETRICRTTKNIIVFSETVTKRETEQVSLAETVQICIHEMLGSDFGQDIDYHSFLQSF
jgi:hypothetical protein